MRSVQDDPTSGLLLIVVRRLPEPLAVETPPTDRQQDLSLGVHIENALAAVGLGKKGRVCSTTNDVQPRTSCAVLLVSRLLEWIHILLVPQGNMVGALAPSLRSLHLGMPSLGDDKAQKAKR